MADRQTMLLDSIRGFVRAQLAGEQVGTLLDQLVQEVVRILDVIGAGVSLGDTDGVLRFVVASDPLTLRAEMWQEEAQEGPCRSAFLGGEAVRCTDIAHAAERWPNFVEVASGLGLRAVAGLPMAARGVTVGALNVYHDAPMDWDDAGWRDAQMLADLATTFVVSSRDLEASRELSDQLQHALDSRVVIEQAKGIIAARREVDLAEAFGLLRARARSSRAPIHEIAAAVVEGRGEP